jgi:hypothetical protein
MEKSPRKNSSDYDGCPSANMLYVYIYIYIHISEKADYDDENFACPLEDFAFR